MKISINKRLAKPLNIEGLDKRLSLLFDNKRIQLALYLLSMLTLLLCSIYAGIQGSRSDYTNADQFVGTYAVHDVTGLKQLVLASDHINAIKIPILWLQGEIGYTYHSFLVLNIILVVGTTVGWSLLLLYLCKKKLLIVFNLILSGILITSTDLAINLSMTTIRNIEYPIMLGTIIIISNILYKKKKKILPSLVYIALTSLLILSDSLFLYVMVPSIILAIFFTSKLEKNIEIINSRISYALLFISVFLGLTMRYVLIHFSFISVPISSPKTIVGFSNLPNQAYEVFREVLSLTGGYQIFGQVLRIRNLGLIISFCISIIMLFFFFKAIKKIYSDKNFIFSWRVVTLISVFSVFAYIVSGSVIIDGASIRYISILSFTIPTIILFFVSSVDKYKNLYLLLFCISFILVILNIFNSQSIFINRIAVLQKDRSSQIYSIVEAMKKNNVNIGLSTYTYSTTTRFYSKDDIRVYPIYNCNMPIPAVVNNNWYSYKPNQKTALIIDETPRGDFESWNSCGDNFVKKIYGEPVDVVIGGYRNGLPIKIYIFNFDIRQKLNL